MSMTVLKRILLASALIWFVGWWGHFFGQRSWSGIELLAIESDISTLRAAVGRSEGNSCYSTEVAEALMEQKIAHRTLIEQSREVGALGFLLYPVFAPFEYK